MMPIRVNLRINKSKRFVFYIRKAKRLPSKFNIRNKSENRNDIAHLLNIPTASFFGSKLKQRCLNVNLISYPLCMIEFIRQRGFDEVYDSWWNFTCCFHFIMPWRRMTAVLFIPFVRPYSIPEGMISICIADIFAVNMNECVSIESIKCIFKHHFSCRSSFGLCNTNHDSICWYIAAEWKS